MRRVDLVTPPMAGHLHPALGIAVRLAEEPGLRVRVVSTAAAQPSITASGLEGVALAAGADEAVERVVNPPHRVGSNPRLLLGQLRESVALQARFRRELLALWASEPPHLVVADFTMASVGSAAEEVGAWWWTTHPSPCVIEGRSGPPAYVGGWRPGTSVLGRARDAVARAGVRRFKQVAPHLAGIDLAAVGVGPVHRPDGSESIYSADRVFALTPASVEYPRALPAAVRQVGPVLFTPPTDHPRPRLAPGRRHVLVTAGTQVPWHKTAVLDATVAAARALPDVDLHVSLGDGTRRTAPGVTVHGYVDYQRDLPGFDAVVHHGGSGVLGHTLAAGLPAVVWPVDYDQPDHAVRLVDAGVAVRLERPELLADAVRRALADPALRAAAERVADEIRRRPAVEAVAAEVRSRLLDP